MNYNALTIHCASFCLDMTATAQFDDLTEEDIVEYLPEVYELIRNRQSDVGCHSSRDYADWLAKAIIRILVLCNKDRGLRNCNWILQELALVGSDVNWR